MADLRILLDLIYGENVARFFFGEMRTNLNARKGCIFYLKQAFHKVRED